ncbi:MAG: dicarboxylate/amino acid:cation symporter [Armatimonadetes bacterium]|nr:dicarboxylate/amino acid:cation symporter [Armatimonadota bacterium]
MHRPDGKLPLHTKIFIGLILGAVLGIGAQVLLGADHPSLTWFVKNLAQPAGKVFLNLIFMIVVPLLFSSLILGVAELGDAARVGRVGLKSLLMTVVLSGLAVALGLIAVNIVKPGSGITPEERTKLVQTYSKVEDAKKNVEQSKKSETAADTIVDLIPKNPLSSAVNALEGGLISFMVFAMIFGIALATVDPEKALPLKIFFESLLAVSLRIIEIVMRVAPYGVFGMIFATGATLGLSAFLALGKYAVLVLVVLAIHQFGVYSLAIRLIAKRSPVQFFKQIKEVMLTAFATSSSNATLPTALRVAQEEVGLPRQISSFVLTVGATANQNGTALFEGVTVLFLAQLFQVPLTLGDQLVVMLLTIVAGVGTAGVPGGAWPMIAVLLARIGVPPEAIGLCLGIDRLLDMSRTVLNVTGDITIAACVSTMEGFGAVIVEEAQG